MTRTLTAFGLLFALASTAVAAPPGLAPRPPGPPPHGDFGPPPHVIDEVREREAEILAWVKDNDPETYQRLTRLKQHDPRSYLGQLVRAARVMHRAERDPTVVDRHRRLQGLEQQVRSMASDYRGLEPKEQKARRAELERVAGELFDLKQEERRAQLEEIELRMQELAREIEERERDRTGFIDGWLDQLLAEPTDL